MCEPFFLSSGVVSAKRWRGGERKSGSIIPARACIYYNKHPTNQHGSQKKLRTGRRSPQRRDKRGRREGGKQQDGSRTDYKGLRLFSTSTLISVFQAPNAGKVCSVRYGLSNIQPEIPNQRLSDSSFLTTCLQWGRVLHRVNLRKYRRGCLVSFGPTLDIGRSVAPPFSPGPFTDCAG